MSKNLTDSRKHCLQYKKENPFGMKQRFIRDFIFRRFRSYANNTLNECGWMFAENSDMHKLWRLYHVKLEEVNRIYCHKLKEYQEKHGRNNFKPTEELRETFKWYLERMFELYKEALKCGHWCVLHHGERDFYLSWFEKNIKKLNEYVKQGEEIQKNGTAGEVS